MTRLETRARVFACLLAALAGFVDAVGFILSGGFFVSFMSGNSTRLAVGVADWATAAATAAAIIAAFVAGVSGGALLGSRFETRRPAAVLALIAFLLAAAAVALGGGAPALAIGLLAFAMGAENAVFERDGEVRLGVTYMTGSLVRVGTGIAGTLLGRRDRAWSGYLLLWTGFVVGAVVGALAYGVGETASLWFASGAAAAMAVASLRISRVHGAD